MRFDLEMVMCEIWNKYSAPNVCHNLLCVLQYLCVVCVPLCLTILLNEWIYSVYLYNLCLFIFIAERNTLSLSECPGRMHIFTLKTATIWNIHNSSSCMTKAELISVPYVWMESRSNHQNSKRNVWWHTFKKRKKCRIKMTRKQEGLYNHISLIIMWIVIMCWGGVVTIQYSHREQNLTKYQRWSQRTTHHELRFIRFVCVWLVGWLAAPPFTIYHSLVRCSMFASIMLRICNVTYSIRCEM